MMRVIEAVTLGGSAEDVIARLAKVRGPIPAFIAYEITRRFPDSAPRIIETILDRLEAPDGALPI